LKARNADGDAAYRSRIPVLKILVPELVVPVVLVTLPVAVLVLPVPAFLHIIRLAIVDHRTAIYIHRRRTHIDGSRLDIHWLGFDVDNRRRAIDVRPRIGGADGDGPADIGMACGSHRCCR
jgi:hypothetical protein